MLSYFSFQEINTYVFLCWIFYFRSRLKKDYDDFRRQPDHDKFARELYTSEEGEGDPGRETPKVEISSKSIDTTEPLDILEKDHFDSGRHSNFLSINTTSTKRNFSLLWR